MIWGLYFVKSQKEIWASVRDTQAVLVNGDVRLTGIKGEITLTEILSAEV